MIEVVCGVIRSDKGYLIAQKKNSLLWEFPGGKVREGETHNEALIREIQEELAIDVKPVFEITRYDIDKYTLIFIYAVSKEISIELKEHQSTVWIELEDHSKYEFIKGDVQFLRHIDTVNLESHLKT